MGLTEVYRLARHEEELSRLRRVLALRGLLATGKSQREVAQMLGVSQPAVSQQLALDVSARVEDPAELVAAAAPVLTDIATEHGFSDVAVYGSVARHEARADSDVDLLVTPPPEATIADMLQLQALFERVLGRRVDLTSRRGLRSPLDDDIVREAVAL